MGTRQGPPKPLPPPAQPAKFRHQFTCATHGRFYVERPQVQACPVLGSCPTCDADPWFNSDIDAGPFGWLGGVIQPCECLTTLLDESVRDAFAAFADGWAEFRARTERAGDELRRALSDTAIDRRSIKGSAMNQNEAMTKLRDVLPPEPPACTGLERIAPVKLRRDAWREGFVCGARAVISDADNRADPLLRRIEAALVPLWPYATPPETLPPQLAEKVAAWLTSNRGESCGFYHGLFPLGMVTNWIERAERAERDAEQGRKVADVANAHGWNGVENSKILSEFIAAELGELARLRQYVADESKDKTTRCRTFGDERDLRTQCILLKLHDGPHYCPDWPGRQPGDDGRSVEQKARDGATERSGSIEDAQDVIAEVHAVLDAAGIGTADNVVCYDPACKSKLAHRVRRLLTQKTALEKLVETLTERAKYLARLMRYPCVASLDAPARCIYCGRAWSVIVHMLRKYKTWAKMPDCPNREHVA